MKKILTVTALTLAFNTAFAQMESLDELFHSGDHAKYAAKEMMKEAMMSVMTAVAESKDKAIDDEAIANMMFEKMNAHTDSLKVAMEKDCAAEHDAQKCACFYQQVDLKALFAEMKKASLEQDEDKAEQSMKAYQESVEKKKAQCKL